MTKIKIINKFFKFANRADVDDLLSKVILTDRQEKVFNLHYLKGFDVCYIADDLGFSTTVINEELCIIRNKIYAFIPQEKTE